jgi:hypothetical protein
MSLISVSRSATFSGAFPFFLSTMVRNNLEAEGRGLKKANPGRSLFFVYCVSVRFRYPVPGNGVGVKGKSWLVR